MSELSTDIVTAATEPVPTDYVREIEDGKNNRTIKCKYCNCIILKPTSGTYVNIEYDLPLIDQEINVKQPLKEIIKHFWLVEDMYTFYNIGFSCAFQKVKFLTCADCERGPIGFHDLMSNRSYLALSRVDYIIICTE